MEYRISNTLSDINDKISDIKFLEYMWTDWLNKGEKSSRIVNSNQTEENKKTLFEDIVWINLHENDAALEN